MWKCIRCEKENPDSALQPFQTPSAQNPHASADAPATDFFHRVSSESEYNFQDPYEKILFLYG